MLEPCPRNDRTVGIAVVGTGIAARDHAATVRAAEQQGRAVRLVSLCGRTAEAARDAAAAYGARATTLAGAVADPEVRAVIVATPSGLHADHAITAMEAGRHVLIEKPLALTLADADRVADTAQRQGVVAAVVAQRRFTPLARRLRAWLADGAFGTLTSAAARQTLWRSQAYYDSAAWRGTPDLDGGVLSNQGYHLIDLMLWLLGPADAVRGLTSTAAHRIPVEDTAAVVSRHGTALLTLSTTTAARSDSVGGFEIHGDRGFVRVVEDQVVAADPVAVPAPDDGSGDDGSGQDPHLLQLADFLAALDGAAMVSPDPAQARRVVEYVQHAQAAHDATVPEHAVPSAST